MAALLEILIFAGISFYLCFRLWSVLGTRTGHEKEQNSSFFDEDNVVPFKAKSDASSDEGKQKGQIIEGEVANITPKARKDLQKLKSFWPDFQVDVFIHKATKAYGMVIDAFTKQDEALLEKLLTPKVLEQFRQALKQRHDAGHTLERNIQEIGESTIEFIQISEEDNRVSIDVRFQSEQLILTKNAQGDVIDNPAKLYLRQDDLWTFDHSLHGDEKIWLLSKTRSKG
jgi:predicted lipid-binding transport protein (Tim44 family)